MAQSLHTLGTHLIFSTKDRNPILRSEFRPAVHAYLGGILRKMGCKSVNVGGVGDHVHLLFDMTKSLSTAKLIEEVKKESSKHIKTLDTALSEFHWQAGYGLFGVSPDRMPTLRQYLQSQEDHHRKESFQDEFRRLLIEANVDFDERYLWT